MNPFKSSEDKEILIDSDNLEESSCRPQQRHSQHNSYVEVPLSCPLESTQNAPIAPTAPTAPTSTDYFSEYDTSKVTFQPCSEYLEVQTEENVPSKPSWKNNYILKRLFRCWRYFKVFRQTLWFHRKLLLSSLLTSLGSSGTLIFFPLHLENVSRGGRGDGYSACLSAATVTTLIALFFCIFLEIWTTLRKSFSESVLRPLLSWWSVSKVGFCLGLSFTTIFYSWEDDKVPCNFQDPLLGLVIIFAIITHAVTRWRNIGLKRTFSLSAIAAGVFLSVDYPLVDHHRCRGYYYRNGISELWTWQVHLVWTLAFVISIWLATVAAFFLENSVPVPKVKHSRLYDLEYNAVKLRVMKPASGRAQSPEELGDNQRLKSYKYNPYVNFHLGLVANSVLWFSIATWALILSLFWTEFIPGFGKGTSVEHLPYKILRGFVGSVTSGSSWGLFLSVFTFSHAFTYLTVLTRSPIAAIAVAMVGFPIIGLWWSFFQIKYSLFVWMPVFSGELICAALGLITVLTGAYYFIKLEVLKPARIRGSEQGAGMYAQYY